MTSIATCSVSTLGASSYVEVEDAPLLVTSLQWKGDCAIVSVNDDTREELAYPTLRQGQRLRPVLPVRSQTLEARLTTQAYYQLADHIVERDGGFWLQARGAFHPIRDA